MTAGEGAPGLVRRAAGRRCVGRRLVAAVEASRRAGSSSWKRL
jgi:hypothetical protein